MKAILLCALAVGGATTVGALSAFIFRERAKRHCTEITCIAAGIMLSAAFSGLIEPAFDGGISKILLAVVGLFIGAACIHISERAIPLKFDSSSRGALLLAIAIAIHNFPEGIAAGLSLASGNTSGAFTVTLGIALHNVPEGMITVFPMLSCGMKPLKAFLISISSAVAEICGTLLGYLAFGVAQPMLPFSLAFAGGTMLFVIIDELIPDGSEYKRPRAAFLILAGSAAMNILSAILS